MTSSTPQTGTGRASLSLQERGDLALSRALPRLSGRAHRTVLQLSGMRVGARKRGIPVALLTTIGRRSGQQRTVPLMYLPDDDRVLVVVSNAGLEREPAWALNLRAEPRAHLRLADGTRHDVVGRFLPTEDREALWPRLVAHNPLWGAFQESSERTHEVVALEFVT